MKAPVIFKGTRSNETKLVRGYLACIIGYTWKSVYKILCMFTWFYRIFPRRILPWCMRDVLPWSSSSIFYSFLFFIRGSIMRTVSGGLRKIFRVEREFLGKILVCWSPSEKTCNCYYAEIQLPCCTVICLVMSIKNMLLYSLPFLSFKPAWSHDCFFSFNFYFSTV